MIAWSRAGADGAECASTAAIPKRDRFEAWREFARAEMKMDFYSALRNDIEGYIKSNIIGNVEAFEMYGNSNAMARTESICPNEALICVRIGNGKSFARTPEDVVALPPGSVCFYDRHSQLTIFGEGQRSSIGMAIPERVFRPLLKLGAFPRPLIITGQDDQTRLLTQYLELTLHSPPDDPAIRMLVGQHLADLAVSATKYLLPGAHETLRRGPRAARLRLAKQYVLNHLPEPGLNAEVTGRSLAISGRAVQMLFEAEGTTFSTYVLEQRLLQALRRLRDPRHDATNISQIAYDAGFVDLSHFNRCFRRRFGDTPSGVRRVEA